MSTLGPEPPGATPLSEEDLAGLRLSWVATREDLNQAEADNILQGRLWAYWHRGRFWYLEPDQLHLLHRRMFGEVWSWAGQQRRRDTNIGIDPHQIAVALRDLCEDTRAQIGDGTNLAYPADELAVRFHHRLVLIHPYPNGNGRHSRLATDLLARDLGITEFSWGTDDITTAVDTRALPHGFARSRLPPRLHPPDRLRQVLARVKPAAMTTLASNTSRLP